MSDRSRFVRQWVFLVLGFALMNWGFDGTPFWRSIVTILGIAMLTRASRNLIHWGDNSMNLSN